MEDTVITLWQQLFGGRSDPLRLGIKLLDDYIFVAFQLYVILFQSFNQNFLVTNQSFLSPTDFLRFKCIFFVLELGIIELFFEALIFIPEFDLVYSNFGNRILFGGDMDVLFCILQQSFNILQFAI